MEARLSAPSGAVREMPAEAPPAQAESAADAPRLSIGAAGAALLVLLLLLAGLYDGAFDVRHWGPVALFALVLLSAMLVRGDVRPVGRPIAIALAGIWGFAAWTLASTAWAESPGLAFEGAGRVLLYAAAVSVAVVAIPTAREMRTVGAILIGGVTLVAAVTLVRMHVDGTSLFVAGRLDTPAGYRNATACLFALAFWPLVGAAVTRGRNPTLRAGAFSAAVLVLGLAFLTQSRGVLLGLLLGGVVALGLATERIRRAFLAILALGGVLILSGPLLTAYRSFESGSGQVSAEQIATATNALTFLVVDAFIVGLLLSLLDGGLRASVENLARARRIAVVGLVVGTVGLVTGGVLAAGNPIEYVERKVDEFGALETRSSEVTRILTTGGERSDLWRVALDEFAAHPVAGVGEGSFAFDYYLDRGTDRNLSVAHSLPLALLAETGLVGVGLFAVFLAGLAVAIASGVRGATLSTRHAVAGLAAAGAVALGQSAVDWTWDVPGVMGLGLVSLALAAGIAAPRPERVAPRRRRTRLTRALLTRALPLAGLLAGAGCVLALFLADFYAREASAASSPADGLAAARTAEDLNPLALSPRYLQASALERLGDRDAAREELEGALALEPENFATLALLGDLEMREGDYRAARADYDRAHELNPRDQGLKQLKRQAERLARRASAAPPSATSPDRG